MYRFFVEEKNENCFILSKELLSHLSVLRLKKNENFYCIYKEKYYECFLKDNRAIIVKQVEINNEYKHQIILFAAIINIKRFEWLIQKACELGVSQIYPLISRNINFKYIEIFKIKQKRFEEIAKNACEQSFRNKIVKINNPIEFDKAININIKNKFIAHEKNKDEIDEDFLFENDCAFFIGPEGGFEEIEIKKALDKKINIVSLGKRILRAETASIYLLSRIKKNN